MILKTGMQCQVCKKGRLYVKFEKIPFEYKSVTVTIPMNLFVCDVCEEGKFIPDEIRYKLDKFLETVRRSIRKDLGFK